MSRLIVLLALVPAFAPGPAGAAEFPTPYNTEKAAGAPLPSVAALTTSRLPEGFHLELLAREPEVQQPIAMAFDTRGRLWVGENYTYAESRVSFATNLNDRIVVFEDTQGNGRLDKRTVFWDQARILTSLETGLGGVFALCPPRLLFIPDKNGDAIPDGEPEVLLDGFATTTGNHHTFANGLKWGPDGWLWGRIGISSGAHIGRPGTGPEERIEMRGGIWRFNPRTGTIQAVCHGTTNPWGLDWNALGEPFFINTVIGHLWHAIPGAHLQRMHGDDVNPFSYALIDQHADHYHFDTAAGWTKSRASADGATFAPGSDSLGGGHAHTGLLIYQGENWPAKYRGGLFTLNFHGRRINSDTLARNGSGYVGRHGSDLVQFGDPWFRGLDLIEGPEGAVYINDWSDTGECHDSDGVHRSSGRIYRLHHGTLPGVRIPNWSALDEQGWETALLDGTEWNRRMASRALLEPANVRAATAGLARRLQAVVEASGERERRLRALWALNITGHMPVPWLVAQLRTQQDEHLLSWLLRLALDAGWVPGADGASNPLVALAERTGTPFLHLYVASALQRIPQHQVLPVARALVAHTAEVGDHNLPRLIWQGIEPVVAADPTAAFALFSGSVHPELQQFIARRITSELQTHPERLNAFCSQFAAWFFADEPLHKDAASNLVNGMADGLRGWQKASAPTKWNTLSQRLASAVSPAAQERLRELGVVFGDGRALDDLKRLVLDAGADPTSRRNAIRTLVESRAPGLGDVLRKAADDGALRVPALVGLLASGEKDAPALTLSRYTWTGLEDRPALLMALAQRTEGALALLQAVERGSLARSDLTPVVARQIASLGDETVRQRLEAVWGTVRTGNTSVRTRIEDFRGKLQPAALQSANLANGRQQFLQACAPCHKLLGDGGDVGPDLSGSGRSNVDYLLENIVDPNAIVPADYRMTTIELKDGRVLTGLLREPTARTVTLITTSGRSVLDRETIARTETGAQSMMPEGLLESLQPSDARDLIAYLQRAKTGMTF